MSAFIKFLISLLAHMAWQRFGGSGPVPPVRLPKGSKTVHLPAIAPWQMMLAMWLVNKIWKQYGRQMKTHLLDNAHPFARRVGSYLPDVPDANPAGAPTAATAPATMQTNTPASAKADTYDTQKLGADPAGSLLTSLRGTQPANG